MSSKMLINAVDAEECRIALIQNNNLEGFYIETAAKEITKGNIYKGVIARIEPSLQAVFVDYGAERHGFLQKHEIHSDYFLDSPNGHAAINKLLRPGQELLVQVEKDPIMKKGAMLSTYLSLAGSYSVLMPGSKHVGVSRQIDEEKERTRLKKIVDGVKLEEGFGLIIRTAAKDQTKTSLVRDIQSLKRLWKEIKKRGVKDKAPCLLHKERSLAIRSVRDYLSNDITEVLVDDTEVYNDLREFIGIIHPKMQKIVKLHKTPKPIFTKHQLEEQIASIFERTVPLKSGGSIVIHPTEALVAVDVNSGKSTKEDSVEKTALSTNLEAAEEIARQLRLRDLGGLVVLDFIDMRDSKNRMAVEKAMRQHTKKDKARIKLGKISKFGLMEMSRQRLRPSIEFGSYIECPHCHGKGLIPSAETLALSFLRKLRLSTLQSEVLSVEGTVPPNVAQYLLNKKRGELLELETRRRLEISIKGDPALPPGESRIHLEKAEN